MSGIIYPCFVRFVWARTGHGGCHTYCPVFTPQINISHNTEKYRHNRRQINFHPRLCILYPAELARPSASPARTVFVEIMRAPGHGSHRERCGQWRACAIFRSDMQLMINSKTSPPCIPPHDEGTTCVGVVYSCTVPVTVQRSAGSAGCTSVHCGHTGTGRQSAGARVSVSDESPPRWQVTDRKYCNTSDHECEELCSSKAVREIHRKREILWQSGVEVPHDQWQF